LTNEARKRLSAIEEFSDLGSGFNVAMRDLDIRGSGNLLGAEQSGFIAEIGFEMYHKILDEAIHELKDDEFKGLFPDDKPRPFIAFTQIDTDLEILIPNEYVTSLSERYNLYSELSKLENEAELQAFQQQLHDRFGPIPPTVNDLLNTMRLQWMGKSIGFEKISLKKAYLRGYFITNQQSPYFETATFRNVLTFVQANPRRTNLKEVKNTLRLSIEGVMGINEAVELLGGMLEVAEV
jgi:transcription-repair coupling factor (superfamily II helicase)